MQRIAVLLTLVVFFVAPLAIPAAQAAEAGTRAAPASACKHHRAKKRAEDKPKKKEKDSKKPYGFEL
jgi:Ni/Co efflux regulator RcnB